MTPTRIMLRMTAGLFVALAATVGFPGHGVIGQGANLARGTAGVRLMHTGAIAFVSQPYPSLVVINPDGTGLRRLTQPCMVSACILHEYVWSPDGRRIAFVRGHVGLTRADPANLSLLVANANGTGEKRLARCGKGDCSAPSWSPDGTQIVFSRAGRLYIVNAGTSSMRTLSRCSSGCLDMMPSWSPDGARIVFIRNFSVYIVNPDGAGLRRLPVLGSADHPVWSPNGHSIAFNNSRGEIATIHADGSHLRVLTQFSGTPGSGAGEPHWSPDSSRISFFGSAGRSARAELWVMHANGSHLRRLCREDIRAIDGLGPDWSPDGRYIAFLYYHTKPCRPWELFVMNAGGSHLRDLKTGASAPVWQPVQ